MLLGKWVEYPDEEGKRIRQRPIEIEDFQPIFHAGVGEEAKDAVGEIRVEWIAAGEEFAD